MFFIIKLNTLYFNHLQRLILTLTGNVALEEELRYSKAKLKTIRRFQQGILVEGYN
jgi:hypothetical protein